MKTYRVAILGCRGRGTAASRAYHAHPRTEVVALCDLVQERLDTLGDELGVAAPVYGFGRDDCPDPTRHRSYPDGDRVSLPTLYACVGTRRSY